jgi:demethylmenaquinone methyltransferase/2-methoxy-6-polyprenyl-1,4-benzoquinol methylase
MPTATRQSDPPADGWNSALLANPHTVPDKRRRVRNMFAAIAPSYDLINRLHSLWLDQRWRRNAVKLAAPQPSDVVIDVACGTGDLALAFADRPGQKKIVGVDFTYEMLPLAQRKTQKRPIAWLNGDAQALPLCDQSADIVSIAFGIRNVADPAAAIKEFARVLRPGGRVVVLEFSLPTNRVLRAIYNAYFRHVLPRTATWISRDRTGAYKYLPQSVNTFIDRPAMIQLLTENGFTHVTQHPMTFGVCVCYRGVKA